MRAHAVFILLAHLFVATRGTQSSDSSGADRIPGMMADLPAMKELQCRACEVLSTYSYVT